MTDTLPLAPAPKTVEIFGVTLSRETLSLIALALGAGIVLGAKIQRSTTKLAGCPDCERQKAETLTSIRRGAADFENMRRRAGGGGEPGGSEGVSASPPAPSPADSARSGKPPIEPAGGDVVVTEDGAAFPFIPTTPGSLVHLDDPLELDELLEEETHVVE